MGNFSTNSFPNNRFVVGDTLNDLATAIQSIDAAIRHAFGYSVNELTAPFDIADDGSTVVQTSIAIGTSNAMIDVVDTIPVSPGANEDQKLAHVQAIRTLSPYASNVLTNTSNFDNVLSAADDTVQKALDTLDNLDISDITDAHTHDGRYYKQTEIDTMLLDYLQLAGGTMTGNLIMDWGTALQVDVGLGETPTDAVQGNSFGIVFGDAAALFQIEGSGVLSTADIEVSKLNAQLVLTGSVGSVTLDGDTLDIVTTAGVGGTGKLQIHGANGLIYQDNSATDYNVWTEKNFDPADYLPLAGGTMTGAINLENGVAITGEVFSSPYNIAYVSGGGRMVFGNSSLPIDFLGALTRPTYNAADLALFTDIAAGIATVDYAEVSGNDAATDVSAAELEELTDGSNTALHVHNIYLPLAGGTMTGDLILNATEEIGSPSSALTTTFPNTPLYASMDAAASVVLALENRVASASGTGAFAVLASNDGAAMGSGHRLGGIGFAGSRNASNIRNAAVIAAFAENLWVDTSDYGTYLSFATTAPGGTSRTEKMKLTGAGVMVVGDDTDNVSVSTDGVYLNGSSTMWDDLRVPALSVRVPATGNPGFAQFKDNGAASQGVFLYWFDPASEQEVYFVAQMPHSWKEGSDIEAHVHWVPADTAPGAGTDVCWGLEYTWANINGTFGNTTIIYGDEQTNGATETITVDKHYMTEIGTITGSGHTLSSMLVCRLFRDATGNGGTDDYDDDAGMLEVDFHYEVDSFGSKEEYVKGP